MLDWGLVYYDPMTDDLRRSVLSARLENDDHNAAALHLRSDGRILASYSGHDLDTFTRFRITGFPDGRGATAELLFDNRAPTTYSNLYPGGDQVLYNFTRARDRDPHVLFSADEGKSWRSGWKLLAQGDHRQRPYVRYAGFGDRIHLTTTDAHPRAQDTRIFHGYVQEGALYDSFGRQVDDNILDQSAPAVNMLTPLFPDGFVVDGYEMTRAWTMDTVVDASTEHPVAVISARREDDPEDHHFIYARFDGVRWSTHVLAPAGGYLFEAEPDYTGLACIDPDDPTSVYVSTPIDPRDGTRTPRYEIYRGRTDDLDGASWTWTSVTRDSRVDNIRPVVPKWDADNTAVLWLRGEYTSFTQYDMAVVAVITKAPSDEATNAF